MKKLLLIILFASISIGLKAQCSGITATGTNKAKVFKSCYDTVVVTSYLNTVVMDTATATKLTVTAPIVGSVTGNAATVTTNANLTGVVTSSWNSTSCIRLRADNQTFTDLTSSGTVTSMYVSNLGNSTINSTSSTTYTDAYGIAFGTPTATGNANITNSHCILATGNIEMSGGRIRLKTGGTTGIGTVDASNLTIRTSNTDRIVVASGGSIFLGGSTTPTSTVQVGGSLGLGYVAKTGAYSISATDITIDCTSGSFTVTLPTAVGITGRVYYITNSGAGTITLGTTSSQTINGSTTQSIAAGGGYNVQSTGSNWVCIGKW